MAEENLESLIKDLYNHARQGLSEDLVAALLETAKKLPTTNEQLLAVRLSGLVTRELLINTKHNSRNCSAPVLGFFSFDKTRQVDQLRCCFQGLFFSNVCTFYSFLCREDFINAR